MKYLLFNTESPRGGMADMVAKSDCLTTAYNRSRAYFSWHIYNTAEHRIEFFGGWPCFADTHEITLLQSVYPDDLLTEVEQDLFDGAKPHYGYVDNFAEEFFLRLVEPQNATEAFEDYAKIVARTYLWKRIHEKEV